MKELDDFSLIQRYAAERSEAAFRELVVRHSDAVFAVCRRRLHDIQLAEDATQKTFAILARKASEVHQLPLRPYLYRIATGCCADIRKERARRAKREARLLVSARMKVESKQTGVLIAAMEEAFERLSGRYRDVLELRYVLDFSVPEVAAALKISIPAAKQRLVRGLAELRSQLAENGALGVVILPTLFPLLRHESPLGLAERTATAALRTACPPQSAPPRGKAPRTRPYLRISALSGVAGTAVLAVMLPEALRPQARPVLPRTDPTQGSLLLPSRTPVPQKGSLSVLQKLHKPYLPVVFKDPQFEQALAVTSYLTTVPIDCDWRSIEAAGVSRTAAIETRGAPGDVLSEFKRIIKAADPGDRIECTIGEDRLLIRAKQ